MQIFYKTYQNLFNCRLHAKLIILLPVRVCSWFASSGVNANANLIVITPKEQTGAESIVYSAGTVTWSSSFTKLGFKNQAAAEQTITTLKGEVPTLLLLWNPKCLGSIQSAPVSLGKPAGMYRTR